MTWLFLGVSLIGSAAAAEARSTPAAHVRFNNARIAEVLEFAMDHSSRFRELVAAIEASNDFVYLDEGRCPKPSMRACLKILPTPGARRLFVFMTPREPLRSVVSQLAHELQHAIEIVAQPAVVDDETLRALYTRIGFQNCAGQALQCWETDTALRVESDVISEINGNHRSMPRRIDPAYFGTWTLNTEVSWFENVPALRQGTRVYSDRGYGLISVVEDDETDAGDRIRTAFVYRPDGLEYTSGCARPPCDSIRILAVDPFVADFEIKRLGAVAWSGRITLARDGSMVVVDAHGVNADGQPARAIVVWDKRKSPTSQEP
jgi:hypothetical protein